MAGWLQRLGVQHGGAGRVYTPHTFRTVYDRLEVHRCVFPGMCSHYNVLRTCTCITNSTCKQQLKAKAGLVIRQCALAAQTPMASCMPCAALQYINAVELLRACCMHALCCCCFLHLRAGSLIICRLHVMLSKPAFARCCCCVLQVSAHQSLRRSGLPSLLNTSRARSSDLHIHT